jgi:magnesium transporter
MAQAAEARPVSVPLEGQSGVVAASVYSGGRRVVDIQIEEAGDWAKKPSHVVWIGLHEPSEELLRGVQRQLGLHDLAIEDALHAHQRPKIEQYGDALFVVARTAQMLDGRIAFGETHLFVGRGYVVSVRHGASATYTPVRTRCEASPLERSRRSNWKHGYYSAKAKRVRRDARQQYRLLRQLIAAGNEDDVLDLISSM